MLAKRIIPCLDVTGGRVVKGVHFVDLVDAGNPVEQAANYDAQGADELTFLDITATSDARAVLLDMIRRVAEQVFIPFTVGGGIRSTEDIREILRAGADKISINTAAVLDRDLISQGSERFGAQCIVVAIDARRVRPEGSPKPDLGYAPDSEIEWRVYTHGGRTVTDIDALEWAREVEQRGAGELLVTSMDADGTKHPGDRLRRGWPLRPHVRRFDAGAGRRRAGREYLPLRPDDGGGDQAAACGSGHSRQALRE